GPLCLRGSCKRDPTMKNHRALSVRPCALALSLSVIQMLLAPAGWASDEAVGRLHALFDAAWERELQENPLTASYHGDKRYNALWPDVSQQAREQSHRADRELLEALARIPRGQLPPAEQLNYDLFERQYRERVAAWPYKPFLYGISQRGGVQTLNETTEILGFETVRDYEDWLNRLRTLGGYVDQHIALLKMAIAEKRTQPRVIMERVLPQLQMQRVQDPERSPFYAAFTKFPDSIAEADRKRLQAEARQAIASVVIPAYQRFEQFFRNEYLPACRTSVGI